MLLVVNVFVEVVLHSRWVSPSHTPVAIKIKFGWIIAGATNTQNTEVVSCHTIAMSDDIPKRFWKVKKPPHQVDSICWYKEEHTIVNHFKTRHSCSSSRQFVVPLPQRVNALTIGEFRSQAIQRFMYLERSLSSKGLSGQFNDVIQKYFDMVHAEQVLQVT